MKDTRGLTKAWYEEELRDSETEQAHRSPDSEYSFYQAVKKGDLTFVRKNCMAGEFANAEGRGVLSKDALIDIKYHFVIAVAMITRHCIDGGMEAEQAYRLSDFYIRKLDDCKDINSVIMLHTPMSLDFTRRMATLSKEVILSKPIVKCTDYIYQHINERITIAQLAEYVELSENYLSRLFKQNLGISASDYIREKKLEKAENLLKYSTYSYIEIANYLAFSSQSHFIQAFEKQYGMTPKKYRDKYYLTAW